MAQEQYQSPTAIAWAKALLELANESKSASAMRQEIDAIRQIVEADAMFAAVLADPAIGHEEKGQLLDKVFKGRASQLTVNFLGLLNVKGRLKHLTEIAAAYDEMLDAQEGKVEVDVTVAQKLDDNQLQAVRQRVSEALKKDAVIRQHVDAGIIGGLILQVRDKLIDGSVRTQLRAVRQKLRESRPV